MFGDRVESARNTQSSMGMQLGQEHLRRTGVVDYSHIHTKPTVCG